MRREGARGGREGALGWEGCLVDKDHLQQVEARAEGEAVGQSERLCQRDRGPTGCVKRSSTRRPDVEEGEKDGCWKIGRRIGG